MMTTESISTTLSNLSIEDPSSGSPLSLARKLRRAKRRLLLEHAVGINDQQPTSQLQQQHASLQEYHRSSSGTSYSTSSDNTNDDLSAVRKLRRMKRRLLLDLATQPSGGSDVNNTCSYPPAEVMIGQSSHQILERMSDSFGSLSSSGSED